MGVPIFIINKTQQSGPLTVHLLCAKPSLWVISLILSRYSGRWAVFGPTSQMWRLRLRKMAMY